jgi:hypothetical protein
VFSVSVVLIMAALLMISRGESDAAERAFAILSYSRMQLTFTSQPALRIIHIGGYWRGLNDVVRQMMLGLCSTGAAVLEYNSDEHPQALDAEGRVYDRGASGPVWLREEHLQPVIDEFRPDLIVCNAGV